MLGEGAGRKRREVKSYRLPVDLLSQHVTCCLSTMSSECMSLLPRRKSRASVVSLSTEQRKEGEGQGRKIRVRETLRNMDHQIQ